VALIDREISRFPYKERPHMPRSSTAPGRMDTRAGVPVRVAFRQCQKRRHPGWGHFRGSIARPMRSPVNASPTSSWTPAH